MAFLTQTRKTFVRGAIVAAALTAVFFVATANTPPMEWLEAGSYYARVRWAAKPGDPSIVIIDVDNASFEIMKEKSWRWPWTRLAWAKTVEHISPGGPRAIVFDAIYSGSQSEDIDGKFAAAMKSSGVVVLGYAFADRKLESDV